MVESKRLLVTGGAGFIGSNLTEALLEAGNEVVVFDSFVKPHSEKAVERISDATIIRGDIRKFYDIEQVGNVDGIFHLAANASLDISMKNPLMDFEVNSLGTVNVLEYSRKHGHVPMVFSSSGRVYDAVKLNNIELEEGETRYDFDDLKYKGIGIGTDFPLWGGCHTPYGVSKLVAETVISEYSRTFDIPAVILRMGPVAGPWQFGIEESGWMAWFAIALMTHGKINVYGDGKQLRDVLDIRDVVNLYLLSMKNMHRMKEGTYNVGNGYKRSCSLLEMASFMEKHTGKRFSIKYSDWKKGDVKVYYSDISPIKRFWEPIYNPTDTAISIFEWLERNKKILDIYRRRI